MQKKLIALAVAAAVAAPMTAAAEVKIYGKMHYSWDFIDNNDATVGADDSDDATGVARASRLGFKGSEDLGDGLKALWQVEYQINTNTAGYALRNTFAGLSGNWGSLLMGRIDTPYKQATGKLDIFADTAADYNQIIGSDMSGGTPFEERFNQGVFYHSPKFNGFQAKIARMSTGTDEGAAGTEENDAWSLSGTYSNGPLYLAAAYEVHSGAVVDGTFGGTASNTNENSSWRVGGGYKFGNSKVGLVYESMEDDAAASALEHDAWLINFAHKFGANTLKVEYGTADDSNAPAANDGADMWAIGVDHAFSKRTSVYALYAAMNNDTGGLWDLNGGNEIGGAATANGAGEDVDVFSVGMVHKF